MFRGLCVSVVILSVAKVMVKGLVTETPASDADAYSTPPAPVTGVVLTTTCSHSNGTPVADPSDLRYFYSILEGDSTLFSIGESSGEFSVADQPFDYEEHGTWCAFSATWTLTPA